MVQLAEEFSELTGVKGLGAIQKGHKAGSSSPKEVACHLHY